MDWNLERFEGCLLGLACGDAVGAAVEFLPRGKFAPVTGLTGGGKFRLNKGEWTDDTAMALCLGESLIERNGFDPLDQMQRYWRWANEGHNSCRSHAFGIGKTVAAALVRFQRTGEPYSGETDSASSGNGSLMRLAPIPMYFARRPKDAIDFAALSSSTTHASAECLACCQYFALVLLRALVGEQDKAKLFPDEVDFEMPNSTTRIKHQRFKNLTADEIVGSGYVVESLEAALWCFWHTDSFEAAILAAANLGDDADTTAAICGQLAGAYYGSSGIPEDWTSSLYLQDHIRKMARQLADQG
ncbi:ADP-ribosylglycohydrolase family protein [Pseudomonas stutzeri]|uniref:ADP-ribosylglycohydrolase family protein n=1 Tax=Stutzerimonas stutzeri TaxID=316 RepID=UPI002109E2BF|nr:ADP-ribosylglycohydrolase family protein [Stutzerimonas stutzeri]MCQ4285926.1 ADP-ribosylglycohydrolase family protein [Stutzerimonas stutzeri]